MTKETNMKIILAAAVIFACVPMDLFSGDSYVTTNVLYPCSQSLIVSNSPSTSVSLDRAIEEIRVRGDIPNLVKKLVKSGDVCAVVGHQWERRPHVTIEYRPDCEYPEHRQCRLCGKFETREPREWK